MLRDYGGWHYRERSAVRWKIECGHAKLLASSRVVHHTRTSQQPFRLKLSRRGEDAPMILPAVTARSVQEHDVLSSLPGLLVEDLALAPQG